MLIKRDARYALLCAQTADIRYRYRYADTIMCASSGASRLHFSCNTVFTLCRSVSTVRLFVFSDQHPDKAKLQRAPSTVSNLTDIESCGRQHSASVFTVPVIIEAIVKIPKYDKHIMAARGAEPRGFLPARYPR